MNDDTKIALITGGSRGLGRDMAGQLADKGRDVILTYRSQEGEAKTVVAQIEKKGRCAVALPLDTGQIGSFPAFAERVRGALAQVWERDTFDFLVNNAGQGVHAAFMETTEPQFDELMNVHFKGVYFLTQTLLPLISNSGRIVNVSSGLARFSFPGYSAYGAMKGAVEVLSRYLAKELGPRGIGVNVVAPGAIATDFGGGAVRDNPELQQGLAAQTALGRVGQPGDISGVVAALLSDEMRWVNGQRIEVSGGMML